MIGPIDQKGIGSRVRRRRKASVGSSGSGSRHVHVEFCGFGMKSGGWLWSNDIGNVSVGRRKRRGRRRRSRSRSSKVETCQKSSCW